MNILRLTQDRAWVKILSRSTSTPYSFFSDHLKSPSNLIIYFHPHSSLLLSGLPSSVGHLRSPRSASAITALNTCHYLVAPSSGLTST